MNKSKFFVFFALLFLTACDPDSLTDITDDIASSGTTTLNIRLTDAPVDLDEVNIDLQQVFVKGPGGFEEIPLGTNVGIYNLLDFQNGINTLIATAELQLTQITEVRLVLGPDNTVVADGEIFPLKVPSGSQSGLKIKVCLDLTGEPQYDLLLDFDAAASIHQTGNGKFIMKPVIHVMNPDAKCSGNDNDYEEEEDDEEENIDLPDNVSEWLAANYGDYDYQAKTGMVCGNDVYEVEATKDQDQLFLYFDLDGNFLQSAALISNDELPEVVSAAIGNDYTDFTLTDGPTYRIETNDGLILYRARISNPDAVLDVIYQEDGSLFCDDKVSTDDEEEEEEEMQPNEVPQEVIDFIGENYPDYHFNGISAETTWCDGTEVYVLKGGQGANSILLYFDLDWNFLQSAEPSEEKDLPAEILTALDNDYSNYKIMNNKAWEITRADGEIWYRIYLKKDHSSDKIYVIYAANGTLICQEN